MPTIVVQTLINDALADLNVYLPGRTVNANDGAYCLSKLNDILDNWNAERQAVWSEVFNTFTLTASLNPHTIGPAASSPTWTLTQRPVTIDGAQLILTASDPDTYRPIWVHTDPTWYLSLANPGLESAIPTDLYYEPRELLGRIYFWPVPSTAYTVRLMTRQLTSQVVITDSIDAPPGYRSALKLTLVEDVAPGFGRAAPPIVTQRAREARARIFANNVTIPPLDLRSGQGGAGYGCFDYVTRTFR